MEDESDNASEPSAKRTRLEEVGFGLTSVLSNVIPRSPSLDWSLRGPGVAGIQQAWALILDSGIPWLHGLRQVTELL